MGFLAGFPNHQQVSQYEDLFLQEIAAPWWLISYLIMADGDSVVANVSIGTDRYEKKDKPIMILDPGKYVGFLTNFKNPLKNNKHMVFESKNKCVLSVKQFAQSLVDSILWRIILSKKQISTVGKYWKII